MRDVIKPRVHLNGTSRDALLEGYDEALRAVDRAIDVVRERACPHGRDYYPQPNVWIPGSAVSVPATTFAFQQHEDRLNRLRSVRVELEEIYEHVSKE